MIIDNGQYSNIEVTYPAFVYSDFKANMAGIRSALLSQDGYKRLEDTYHPDEFRLGYFRGGIEVEARPQNDAGQFELTFTCKPQRFLKSGETYTAQGSDFSIENPTMFPSKPLISVHGYGHAVVNGFAFDVADMFPWVHIDSELCDCYYNGQNANEAVTFEDEYGYFPTLAPGENVITMSGNITLISIQPRWFIL